MCPTDLCESSMLLLVSCQETSYDSFITQQDLLYKQHTYVEIPQSLFQHKKQSRVHKYFQTLLDGLNHRHKS